MLKTAGGLTNKNTNTALLVAAALGLTMFASVDANATTTALSGSAGAYTINGTDTYGFKGLFVKVSNFLTASGVDKIIGMGGGAGAAYTVATVPGGMVKGIGIAAASAVVSFLPNMVDGFYGALC